MVFGIACLTFTSFVCFRQVSELFGGCVSLEKELPMCFKDEELYIAQEMVPILKGDNVYCHPWLKVDEVCVVTKA